MSKPKSPAERLLGVLERNRAQCAPNLPENLLVEVAEIQIRYQFDDDRKAAHRDIREAVETEILREQIEGTDSA